MYRYPQISMVQMNFQELYISNCENQKSFVETSTPYNQILMFKERRYVGPIWIFVFDTDQAQIFSTLFYFFVKSLFKYVLVQCSCPCPRSIPDFTLLISRDRGRLSCLYFFVLSFLNFSCFFVISSLIFLTGDSPKYSHYNKTVLDRLWA
jgi:hypothetical protein